MADELHTPFLQMFLKDDDDSDDDFGTKGGVDIQDDTEGGVVIQEDTPQGFKLALEHPPEKTPFEIGKYVVLVYFISI